MVLSFFASFNLHIALKQHFWLYNESQVEIYKIHFLYAKNRLQYTKAIPPT